MTTIQTGIRQGHESLASIHASEHIRPLRDVIVVEPLPLVQSTLLAVVDRARPVRGVVRAVGPGVYPKRYNGPKGSRSRSWNSKAFRPTDLKPGDIVHFGDHNRGGDLFHTVRWGDKEMVVCREEDVTGVEA